VGREGTPQSSGYRAFAIALIATLGAQLLSAAFYRA